VGRTNWTFLLIAALALGGGGGFMLSGRSTPPAPRPDVAKAKAAKKAADGTDEPQKRPGELKDPYYVLERFTGVKERASTPAKRAEEIVKRLDRLGYARPMRFLVATVPDPQDSRFAKLFDDVVTGIRTAIESLGYVDDRFFDPWRPDVVDDDQRPLRRTQPTTLLFRNGDAHPRAGVEAHDLIAVLLVGESPARGVHGEALRAALSFVKTMNEAEGASPEKRLTLDFLGPTLSGTAESLRATLVQWFDETREQGRIPFNLQFITGTATSEANRDTLGADLATRINGRRGVGVRFSSKFGSTIHPDGAKLAFAVEYLDKKLHAKTIALLTESSTAYGFAVGAASRNTGQVIQLSFPLHIAKLRNEFDRQQAEAAEPASPDLKKRLALDRVEDGEVDEDAYPAKSRATQAASEISLEQTLRAISTENVQAVVIAASSTADVLFLVEKVRQSFPNVPVVVDGADLAYLHADVSFMEGVLIASTYPLLPWTQRLVFPFNGDQNRLLFPSEAAEGVYNAATQLLTSDATKLVDYGPPLIVPDSVMPFRPSLWMSVVSRGTFWPVEVCSALGPHCDAAIQARSYLSSSDASIGTKDPAVVRAVVWAQPRVFTFWLGRLVLCLLDLLLVLGYCVPFGAADGRSSGRFGNLLQAPEIFPHPRMQRFEVAMLLLVAFLVSSGFLAVDLATILPLGSDHANDPADRMARAALATFGAVVAFLLAVTVHAVVDWLDTRSTGEAAAARGMSRCARLGWTTGGTFGCALFMLVVARKHIEALARADGTTAEVRGLMLFIERARNLDSGVSLLWTATLIGAGLALWILGSLRQVRIAEDAAPLRRYGVIPAARPAPGSLLAKLGLETLMRGAVAEAEGVWPKGLGGWVMAFVLVDTLWIGRRLLFFEQSLWGVACVAGYGVLLALVVYACNRYLHTWRALENVLARAAPGQMTQALARIPTELITSFKRPWDADVFDVWIHHCHDVLGRLDGDPALLDKAAETLGIARADLQELAKPPVPCAVGATRPSDAVQAPEPGKKKNQTENLWEDFLAMRLVAYVHYVRTQLSNFVAVSTAVLVVALWATNFYPLAENRFLLMLVLAVTVVAVSIAGLVSVQMSRNYVLSKMDRTAAGQVSWDSEFVANLLTHVALPVLTLLAVKFPELGRGWTAILSAISSAKTGGS
jgi:hypothetical protein